MNYIIEYKVLSSIDAVITVPAFHRMVIISCVIEKKKLDFFDFFDSFKG